MSFSLLFGKENEEKIEEVILESTGKTFIERLLDYRLTKTLTDVKLKVGNQNFDAHKIVLMGASPVFAAMLSDRWLENDGITLVEDCVDPNIFNDLLNFLYCDKIQLTIDNVQALVKAADYLDLSRLLYFCEKFMVNNLRDENFNDFYQFSKYYRLKTLKVASLKRMTLEIAGSPTKLNLNFDYEDFRIILKELRCLENTQKMKENYFDCIIAWVKHDEINRKTFLPNLLELISFKEFSYNFVKNKVLTNTLIKDSHACCLQIMDALTHFIENPIPHSFMTFSFVNEFSEEDDDGYDLFD